jgi:T5SS/PEP-CTERM-associated repeat protein
MKFEHRMWPEGGGYRSLLRRGLPRRFRKAEGRSALALASAVALAASSSWAGISSSGDVTPPFPRTWTSSTNGVIGGTGNGTVRVYAGGALLSNSVDLGLNAGATGTVIVDGTASTWAYNVVHVGNSGNGIMNIINGGSISNSDMGSSIVGLNADSQGTVTVDGAGSLWYTPSGVTIGYSGNGTLYVTNGGTLATNGWDFSDFLGYSAGATGTATVDGAGSTWAGGNDLYVGVSGTGTLSILNGGQVSNNGRGIFGSMGMVTVDGAGSRWTTGGLSVGNGTLRITNSGIVTAGRATSVGNSNGSGGTIDFGLTGGTLTTESLYASPGQFAGTGRVNARGLISDIDLRFDASHGLSQTLTWNGVGQAVTVGLDMTGVSSAVGDLGAGCQGAGTLTIRDGLNVTCRSGYIGYNAGSSGTVTVSGPGSTWTMSSTSIFDVGWYGHGVLNILGGGKVTGSYSSNIGTWAGSRGTVTVDGQDSSWSMMDSLNVGGYYSGDGTLNITNGGSVSAKRVNVTGRSTINFGASGGTLTTQNLYAAPTQLTGTGTINTLGLVSDFDLVVDATHGPKQALTWNNTGQTVTVNLDLSGTSGTGSLGLGYVTGGSLAIRDGITIAASSGALGYNAGTTGTAAVEGIGSTWTVGYDLNVGFYGTGTLRISSGGKVSGNSGYLGRNAGATGTVTVDGIGSTLVIGNSLYVGTGGPGALTVTNGGGVHVSATSGSTSYIDSGTSAPGAVSVFGVGSTWYNGNDLCIGHSGTGTFSVVNGGAASNSSTYVANNSGSTGSLTIDGTGSTWTNRSNLYVGYSGTGTLNILHGGIVNNATSQVYNAYLGYNAGSRGNATIDGAGSTWNVTNGLYVGYSGIGTLNIINRGMVAAFGPVRVAYNGTAVGSIDFGANGGTLTCQSLYAGRTAIHGTGTIFACGLVSDFDLVLDGTHGLNQTLEWNGPGQVISIHLDLTGSSGGVGDLGVGYQSAGSLAIRDGVKVTTFAGYLGYQAGATGIVSLSGSGSTWTKINSDLYVGYGGSGTLSITNGGMLDRPRKSYLGYSPGATGMATVDGAGSLWTNVGDIQIGYAGSGTLNVTAGGKVDVQNGCSIGYQTGASGMVTVDGAGSTLAAFNKIFVGYNGSGVLNIRNGGAVTAYGVGVNSTSLLAMNVGDGSILDMGSGRLDNGGTIRLKAVPGLAAGTYSPIKAGGWPGTGPGAGTFEALGGSWNATGHVFIVSAVVNGTSGQGTTMDMVQNQRVVITEPTSGDCVWAGFQATVASKILTFGAVPLGEAETALLESSAAGQDVLDGWTFETSGYTAGDPVYVSMKVGSGLEVGDMTVWHYDGVAWTPYAAGDLTYDGMYASWTVNGFSGYAVTAVPEPGALSILGVGALGVLLRRHRVRGSWRKRWLG